MHLPLLLPPPPPGAAAAFNFPGLEHGYNVFWHGDGATGYRAFRGGGYGMHTVFDVVRGELAYTFTSASNATASVQPVTAPRQSLRCSRDGVAVGPDSTNEIAAGLTVSHGTAPQVRINRLLSNTAAAPVVATAQLTCDLAGLTFSTSTDTFTFDGVIHAPLLSVGNVVSDLHVTGSSVLQGGVVSTTVSSSAMRRQFGSTYAGVVMACEAHGHSR